MLWVYRTADGVFLRDKGSEPVLTGQAVADIPRVPDMDLERYGDPTTPIRLATATELLAAKTARMDLSATRLTDDVVAKALARVTFEELQKCTVKAGQTLLTAAEFRDRIKALITASL